MFCNFSSSATQPPAARRQHQPRHGSGFQRSSQWSSYGEESEGWNGNLDLSMHHPSAPFGNRFDALAPPPPAVTRERVFHFSSPRRRTRNSRGTKEAKKRRDAKRNRRKLAAQFLDEQLPREIDETLDKANIRRPEPVGASTVTPTLLTTSLSQQPTCTALTRYTPILTPQLPPLNFSRLDLGDFPYLPTPRQSPSLSPHPPICMGVPSWCPSIPSRMQNRVWADTSPRFWDLSSLPEPKESLRKEKSQELQLWKGALDLKPQRQSRFFPPSASPKPVVKLPPAGCKLHWSEEARQDPISTAWNAPAPVLNPRPAMSTVEKIIAAVQAEAQQLEATQDPPSAANLWHILSSALNDEQKTLDRSDKWSWDEDIDDTGGVPLDPLFNYESLPAELEAPHLPYVHSNSLTGYSNDTGSYHANRTSDEYLLSDSAIYLADMFSPIDDAPPPFELAAMPWPLTPRPATPSPAYESVVSLPPLITYVEAETNTDSDDLAHSIDHFESEQQLFDPAQLPLPKTPAESECDLAMFLSMGHVENCWCRDCEDDPELVNEDLTTSLTEDYEGWLVWSSAESNTDSATTRPSPMIHSSKKKDGSEVMVCAPTSPDWDDLFPYPPICQPDDTLDYEETFLGYYDDGPAFAREEQDYD